MSMDSPRCRHAKWVVVLTIWIGCAWITPACSAEAQPGPEKTQGETLEHPFLFYRKGELEELRRKFENRPHRYYLEALVRDAEQLMERDPREKHGAHNSFPNAVQAMVWSYLLTGEEKFRDRAMTWIRVDWDRKEFGEWSEMGTAAVAVAYDTLYHELSQEERSKMKAYLERALAAHLKKSGGWLYNNPSNTVPAQCGAAGMAALVLHKDSPKAEEAIEMTVAKLKRWFANICFSPDGGYTEGTLYWDFGGSHYLMFAHALHNTTGDDSLLNHERLTKQHRFLETILGGNGEMMPFNDTQPRLYALPVLADLGTRYDNDLMLWVADYMARIKAEAAPDAKDISVSCRGAFTAMAALFRGKQKGPTEFPGIPTVTFLERMEWGAMRSDGQTFIPELMVGVKGSGGPLSHHKQNDLGSFMLYAGGEMLLLDPGYFQGGKRDHTLPLVNDHGPKHSGSEIVEAWEGGAWRAMTIDSTPAYGRMAKRVRRTLVMHGEAAVVVLDDIVAGDGAVRAEQGGPAWTPPPIGADPEAIKATAQYQAAQKPTIDAERGMVSIVGHETTLDLWTFGPKLTLDARERDFGKSWHFQNLAERGVYRWHSLEGHYTLSTDDPLVTVLLPRTNGEKSRTPEYQRRDDRIEVSLPDGTSVVFKWVDGQWAFDKPTGVK